MKQLALCIPAIIALAACICLIPLKEVSNAILTAPAEIQTAQTEVQASETLPQTAPSETETVPPVTQTETTPEPETIALAEVCETLAIVNVVVEPRTEAPTESRTDALPVSLYCQYPDYPTGCECAALYMLLQFYGTEVTMQQLADAIPKGNVPYETEDGILHGANPEKVFVGDPRNSNSYGVFNAPIAQTANQFREGAVSRTGAALEDALAIVDSGNPVIAWYTMDPEYGIVYRRSWIDDETGNKIVWPGNEHAIVITWHDDTSLSYNDSYTGTTVTVGIEKFREIFDELGGRIVYYEY